MTTNDAAPLDLALSGADVAPVLMLPMLMATVHLSGEERWLDEVSPCIAGLWNFHENDTDTSKQSIWLESGCPGCGVDILNQSYSLLFEPNHDWPEYFLKRNELWAYMEGVADKFDNRRHIRFKAEAKSVIYNESSSDWDIQICSADSTTESLIEKDAIVTKDGTRHEADPIVLATGFLARKMLWPMHVHGRDGQAIRDLWGDDNPRARLGIAVPGFPNMFMLYGPGTNLAHGGSAIYHTECQVRYIMQCLRELLETGATTMECRCEPLDAYNRFLDETHANMVWAHPGVGNWYKNKDGRVVTNSPFRLVDYRRMMEQLDRNDYIMA